MPNQSEFLQYEMDQMTQTLAVGKTALQARYPELGFSQVDMKPSLDKCFGMLVGIPGCGKSAILQSNPSCYSVNLDLSPTVVSPIKGIIWPGLSRDGRPLDVDSKPFNITWEKVREKIDLLIRLSQQGASRPSCVAFDSLHGMVRLLKDFLIRKVGANKPGVRTWKDLDGRAAWDDLYEIICALPYELRGAGYGVWYTCHLGKKYVQLSQEVTEVVPELTITDGFFKRLHPVFDIVAPVKVKILESSVEIPVDLKDSTGKVVGQTKQLKTTVEEVHNIDFSDPLLLGITKGRNIRGSIPFGVSDGWEKFEEAYKQANPDAYS